MVISSGKNHPLALIAEDTPVRESADKISRALMALTAALMRSSAPASIRRVGFVRRRFASIKLEEQSNILN